MRIGGILPESLNEFLVRKLEPISEADPTLLANYVAALLRNEKSLDELKEFCLEQLNDFLGNSTEEFVEDLFSSLNEGLINITEEDGASIYESFKHSGHGFYEKGENANEEALEKISVGGDDEDEGRLGTNMETEFTGEEADQLQEIELEEQAIEHEEENLYTVDEEQGYEMLAVQPDEEEQLEEDEESSDDDDRNHKHRRRIPSYSNRKPLEEAIEEAGVTKNGGVDSGSRMGDSLRRKRPLSDDGGNYRGKNWDSFDGRRKDSFRSSRDFPPRMDRRDQWDNLQHGPPGIPNLGIHNRFPSDQLNGNRNLGMRGIPFRPDGMLSGSNINLMPRPNGMGDGWAPGFHGHLSFPDSPDFQSMILPLPGSVPQPGQGFFPGMIPNRPGIGINSRNSAPWGNAFTPLSANSKPLDVPGLGSGMGLVPGSPNPLMPMGLGLGMGLPRSRCPDFEERGFCLRGDLCPMDHGANRIVVDDIKSLQQLNLPLSSRSNSPQVASGKSAMGQKKSRLHQSQESSVALTQASDVPPEIKTNSPSKLVTSGKDKVGLQISEETLPKENAETDYYDPDKPFCNREKGVFKSGAGTRRIISTVKKSPNLNESIMASSDGTKKTPELHSLASSGQDQLAEPKGYSGGTTVWHRIGVVGSSSGDMTTGAKSRPQDGSFASFFTAESRSYVPGGTDANIVSEKPIKHDEGIMKSSSKAEVQNSMELGVHQYAGGNVISKAGDESAINFHQKWIGKGRAPSPMTKLQVGASLGTRWNTVNRDNQVSETHMSNSTLFVRGLPLDAPNLHDKLVEHFSQFGQVVNVRIAANQDKAFVQFAKRSDAEVALRSPDAVMGNRFIRVFWAIRDNLYEGTGVPKSGSADAVSDKPVYAQLSLKMDTESTPQKNKISLAQGTVLSARSLYGSGNVPGVIPAIGASSSSAVAATAGAAASEQKKKLEMLREIQKKKENLLKQQIEQQKQILEKLKNSKKASEKESSIPAVRSSLAGPGTASTPDQRVISNIPSSTSTSSAASGDAVYSSKRKKIDTGSSAIPASAPASSSASSLVALPHVNSSDSTAVEDKLDGSAHWASSGMYGDVNVPRGGNPMRHSLAPNRSYRFKIDNRSTVLKILPPLPPEAKDQNLVWSRFSGYGEVTSVDFEYKSDILEKESADDGEKATEKDLVTPVMVNGSAEKVHQEHYEHGDDQTGEKVKEVIGIRVTFALRSGAERAFSGGIWIQGKKLNVVWDVAKPIVKSPAKPNAIFPTKQHLHWNSSDKITNSESLDALITQDMNSAQDNTGNAEKWLGTRNCEKEEIGDLTADAGVDDDRLLVNCDDKPKTAIISDVAELS